MNYLEQGIYNYRKKYYALLNKKYRQKQTVTNKTNLPEMNSRMMLVAAWNFCC